MPTDDSLPPARDLAVQLPELLTRIRPALRPIFYRYHLSLEDAEDVLQDALLAAIRRWSEIEHHEAWLLGTVRRMCLRRRQRCREHPVLGMDPHLLELAAGWLPPPQERRDCMADLELACATLPARQRQVLLLRHVWGLSVTETSRTTGLRLQTVRGHTHRAASQLRQLLGPRRPLFSNCPPHVMTKR